MQGKRKVAEILHILQPLAHLSSLAVFGQNSWKPLILSLVLDCSSLSLHSQAECLTERERRELVRRRMALLFYLLRSPLYDRKSKVKSVFFINVGTRVGKGGEGWGRLMRGILRYILCRSFL